MTKMIMVMTKEDSAGELYWYDHNDDDDAENDDDDDKEGLKD